MSILRLRVPLAGALLVLAALASAPRPAVAQTPASGQVAAAPLTREDRWAFVDRRMSELDPLWREGTGAYVTRGGYFSTRMIANTLAVHAWAAIAGHQGASRRDERIAPMAAMLSRFPAFVEKGKRPSSASQFHLPGWTSDPTRYRPTQQHVALDAEVAEALKVAWMARDVVGLPAATSDAIVHAIQVTARSRFYRWPAVRLNQFNWQARLYGADSVVSGDAALLRDDYRHQLTDFLSAARHTGKGHTTNLNDGLGFMYLPNRLPSQRANRTSTSEYGNMVFEGLSNYATALTDGMRPLSNSQSTLLRAWAQRLLYGEWTHAGYLNWDTGLGFRRWQLARYWVSSLSGLATLADEPILPRYERAWARWIFDRALAFYESYQAEGRSPRFPSTLFGIRSYQGDPVHGTRLFTTSDPEFVAARIAATVAHQIVTGAEDQGPEQAPPPLYAYDAASRRMAVTTSTYSTAVVDRATAAGYGGSDLARLFDGHGHPLGSIGSSDSHGFGLRVTSHGRALLETQKGRRSAARMSGPARRRGTFAHLTLRALVRGRRHTRVSIGRRFLADRIVTSYSVRGPSGCAGAPAPPGVERRAPPRGARSSCGAAAT